MAKPSIQKILSNFQEMKINNYREEDVNMDMKIVEKFFKRGWTIPLSFAIIEQK